MSGVKTSTLTCEPSVIGDYFTWKIDNPFNDLDCVSNLFQFCGHWCYLSFHFGYFENSFITLHVTSAPFKDIISCHYSIDLKYGDNNYGTTADIQIAEESSKIRLFEGWLEKGIEPGYLNFSWCETKFNNISQQGVQTKPENINVLERGTQTEDALISYNCDICSHSEEKSNKFLEILSKDLSSFYEDKKDPDCVLRVGETKFPVHRSMLSARSSVFAAMFHHDTSESQSGEVNILDVDAGVLNDVLYYIYAGKVRGLTPDTAAFMYVVSDKYALIDLRDECLNFLENNINMENVCDAALVAHMHAEAELENKVVLFIEDKLEELIETEKWKNFSDTHLKLAKNLFCSACMVSKKKIMK